MHVISIHKNKKTLTTVLKFRLYIYTYASTYNPIIIAGGAAKDKPILLQEHKP